MKLYMNKQNRVTSEPPASTQTYSNDQPLAAMARQQAFQEATLREQKRIQELEADLRGMQLGIDIINGPTASSSSGPTAQTYTINGRIIKSTTAGSVTNCFWR